MLQRSWTCWRMQEVVMKSRNCKQGRVWERRASYVVFAETPSDRMKLKVWKVITYKKGVHFILWWLVMRTVRGVCRVRLCLPSCFSKSRPIWWSVGFWCWNSAGEVRVSFLPSPSAKVENHWVVICMNADQLEFSLKF